MYRFLCGIPAAFFSLSLTAQVLVHEEPFHRPVFKNDKVRILDVRLAPHDTSLYHLHHTPSVFIFFTGTSYGAQELGGEPVDGRFILGKILFENLASPNTRVHRVWNTDSAVAHVIDIELLYKDSGFSTPPLLLPGGRLAVDTPWVRVYQISLAPGETLELGERQGSLVLISLNAAVLQVRQKKNAREQQLTPGDFFWLQAGEHFAIRNHGPENARFALLELPQL